MDDSQNTKNLSEVIDKYKDSYSWIDIRQITSSTKVRQVRLDAVQTIVKSIKKQGWINDSVVYVMIGGVRETENDEVPRQEYVLIEGAHRIAALGQLALVDCRFYKVPVCVLKPMPTDVQLFIGMGLNTGKKATVMPTFLDTLMYMNRMSLTLVGEIPAIREPHPENNPEYFLLRATNMFKHLVVRGFVSGDAACVTFRSHVALYNWLGAKGFAFIKMVAAAPTAKIFSKTGLTRMSKICAKVSTSEQRCEFLKAAYRYAQDSPTKTITADDLKTIRLRERIAAGEVQVFTGQELPSVAEVLADLEVIDSESQPLTAAALPTGAEQESGRSLEEPEGGPSTCEIVCQPVPPVNELPLAHQHGVLEISAAIPTTPAAVAPVDTSLVPSLAEAQQLLGHSLEGAEEDSEVAAAAGGAATSTPPATSAASPVPTSLVPSLAEAQELLGHRLEGAEEDREVEPSAGGAARVTASTPELEAVRKRLADAASNKKYFADRKRAREGGDAAAGKEVGGSSAAGGETFASEGGSGGVRMSPRTDEGVTSAADELAAACFTIEPDDDIEVLATSSDPLPAKAPRLKLPQGGRCHMCVGFDHLPITYGRERIGYLCVVCKQPTHAGACGSMNRRVVTCRRCLSKTLPLAAAIRGPRPEKVAEKRPRRELTAREAVLAAGLNAAMERDQEKKRRAKKKAKVTVSAPQYMKQGVEATANATTVTKRLQLKKLTEQAKAATAAIKAHREEKNREAEERRKGREERQKQEAEEAAARLLAQRQQRAALRQAAYNDAERRALEGEIMVPPLFQWPTTPQDAYDIAIAESRQYDKFQLKHFTEYLFLLSHCPHLEHALTTDTVPNIGAYLEAERWWAEYACDRDGYTQLMQKYYKEESILDAANPDGDVALAVDKRASTRSAARLAEMSDLLPPHIKQALDAEGYIVLHDQFRPDEELTLHVRACALGGTDIFNNPRDAPGMSSSRMQRVFDPYIAKPSSRRMADFAKEWAPKFKAWGLDSSDWAALHSKKLCRGQYPHVDFILTPEIRRARVTHNVAMPLVAEFGLEPGSSLVVWPGSHKPPFTKRLHWKSVLLPPGSILIMRGDLYHAGAAYLVENTRLHVYLDTPNIVHEKDVTFKVNVDEEARPFIILPPYM